MNQIFHLFNKRNFVIFTVLIVSLSSLLHLQFYDDHILFNYPEFFVNYSTGLIRRGLDGEVIYRLSNAFNLNPLRVRTIYWLINMLIFILLLNTSFKKFPLFFIFSSTLLLSEISGAYIFKKDIILINLFFLLVYVSRFKIYTQVIIFNLLLIVGTLIHEVFFLFAFIPCILLFKIKRLRIYSIVYLLPSIFVFGILTKLYIGNMSQIASIISSWRNSEINPASMSYLNVVFNENLQFHITDVLKSSFDYFGLFINILLNFIFVVAVVRKVDSQYITKFVTLFIFQNAILIILCFVAVDYSRWFFFANFTSLIAYKQIKSIPIPIYHMKFINILPTNEIYILIFFLILGCPTGGWTIKSYVFTTPVYKFVSTSTLIYNSFK